MSKSKRLRVGRVTVYLRGRIWYLRYHENGRRRQIKAGADKNASRQLAAQVNAQLENGAIAATSFQPISIADLRKKWLDHHEHVQRSSMATVISALRWESHTTISSTFGDRCRYSQSARGTSSMTSFRRRGTVDGLDQFMNRRRFMSRGFLPACVVNMSAFAKCGVNVERNKVSPSHDASPGRIGLP